MSSPADTEPIIIVGAGIAGLAAAILLARDHGCKVEVYEAATDLSQKLEESYPIGVNPRGMNVLDKINPSLRKDIELSGLIDGWSINANDKEVAKLPSGVVVGTTRITVIACLYKEAQSIGDSIKFHTGYKLQAFDVNAHILSFVCNGEDVKVDASKARILDGTGCWSKIRTALSKAEVDPIEVDTFAWGTTFRNLFSSDDPQNVSIDPKWHYIFSTKMSGIYAAVLTGKKWVFSLGCNDDSPWLLENEPTPENIAKLKAYVADKCPPAAKMLDESEYERFFGRRSFTGQVVKVSRLNQGEHVALFGDSAHAVIPATGEGTNAALEDVTVLLDALVASREPEGKSWFEEYNTQRLPDANALSNYAKFLAEGAHIEEAEKNRRTANFIFVQITRKLNIYGPTWNEMTFGPESVLCTPYRECYETWQRQSSKVSGLSNVAAWFANRKLPAKAEEAKAEEAKTLE